MAEPNQVAIGSVKRAFDIIEVVTELEAASLSEIGSELGMPQSTVYEHVETLVDLGYLGSGDDGYRLGLKFVSLGESARRSRSVYETARPEVEHLASETGERANLMIEENGRGVIVYRVTGESRLNLGTHPGSVVPLHVTALGKAILAQYPDDRALELFRRQPKPQPTAKTITTEDALLDELNEIRERGYAIDDEENNESMRCVAAPVVLDGEVVAALSVSGPIGRIQGRRFEQQLPQTVQTTANVIEVNLKYS